MSGHTHSRRARLFLATGIFILAVLLLGARQTRLGAQEQETKVDTSDWTESMRAVYADTQPPANNAPATFTPCVGGFAGIYPCNNVDLMSVVPHGTMGGSTGNDIWGWTDPLDGDEYALVGQTNGTAFVDVSDPENPVYLGRLPSHTGNSSTWRDIKVYADHAYIVADGNSGHGMQVFDLTELRNVPAPPVTFSETAHYSQVSSAHNVAINEDTGYAYIVGASACSGGLHMVDLSNPTSPTFAGCYSGDGYTHDVQCVVYNGPDINYQGDEICFAANEDTLTIVDVTNKAAPVQLSRNPYSGASYAHQGWLTEDQAYFLLGDELDESNLGHNTRTYIWDLSDLTNPVNFANYTGPLPSIDHNLYTRGGYAFESNYSSGLRIIDLDDIANGNLAEAAFFDTYPDNNSTNFSGQWSNYPYFSSGIVIANDRQYGLFVLSPALDPDFTIQAEETSLAVCGDDTVGTTINLGSQNGYTGTVTLSANGLPAGASAAFTPNPVVVPGSSNLDVTTSGVSAGSYPFAVNGTDGTLSHDADLTLDVADGVPGAPTLISPPNGATAVAPQPTFTWNTASQGVTYDLEVATDSSFSNVIYSATGVSGTSHTATSALPAGTELFWRVGSGNACGAGAFSETFSFTTAVCAAPNLGIPDNNPTGVSDELILTGNGTISDLNISLGVEHTWVGDLEFTLEHVETGTVVTFFDRPGVPGSTYGCSGNDIDATIDDEAATPVESECAAGTPTIQGVFIGGDPPNSSLLAAFDGETVAGTWRLTAADLVGGDTGTIQEWCVLTESEPVGMAGITTSGDSELYGDAGTVVTHTVTLTNTGTVTDSYDLSLAGNAWDTSLSTNVVGPLAPNASTSVEVYVTVGMEASDQVELSVTSQFDNGVSEMLTLTTYRNEIIEEHHQYIPLILNN